MSEYIAVQPCEPIFVDSIEIRQRENHWFVIVRSNNGECGICKALFRLPDILSLFERLVAPFFIGKDVRNIEQLVDQVYTYRSNYKYDSMPFWCCVAHLELAILDLLGKHLDVSVSKLFGGRKRDRVPVYLSSLRRDTSPSEELGYLLMRAEETGVRAGKLKIGGRMSSNRDVTSGWTEQMISGSREVLGENFTIFLDANSSYTPKKAIEIGRMLEEYGIELFEEPVPWHDFEGTKRVATELSVPIGAGEQEYDWYSFKWLIENRAIGVIQPDVFYNGGLIRTLRIAELAAEYGIPVAPHSPKSGPAASAMLHLVSLVAAPWSFQEFLIDPPILESWYSPHLVITNGLVSIPNGSGLGFVYDQTFLDGCALIARICK